MKVHSKLLILALVTLVLLVGACTNQQSRTESIVIQRDDELLHQKSHITIIVDDNFWSDLNETGATSGLVTSVFPPVPFTEVGAYVILSSNSHVVAILGEGDSATMLCGVWSRSSCAQEDRFSECSSEALSFADCELISFSPQQ